MPSNQSRTVPQFHWLSGWSSRPSRRAGRDGSGGESVRATSVAGQLPNLPRGCHIIRPPSWHMSLARGTRIVPTKSSVSWAPAGWDRASALEIRSPRSPLTCCWTGRQRQRLPPAVHPRSPDAPDDWDLELRAGACLTCGSWVNRSMNRWIRTRQNRIRVGMERALLDARKVRYHSRRMSRLQLAHSTHRDQLLRRIVISQSTSS
jgi:hypothetical protein